MGSKIHFAPLAFRVLEVIYLLWSFGVQFWEPHMNYVRVKIRIMILE